MEDDRPLALIIDLFVEEDGETEDSNTSHVECSLTQFLESCITPPCLLQCKELFDEAPVISMFAERDERSVYVDGSK